MRVKMLNINVYFIIYIRDAFGVASAVSVGQFENTPIYKNIQHHKSVCDTG